MLDKPSVPYRTDGRNTNMQRITTRNPSKREDFQMISAGTIMYHLKGWELLSTEARGILLPDAITCVAGLRTMDSHGNCHFEQTIPKSMLISSCVVQIAWFDHDHEYFALDDPRGTLKALLA